MEQAGIQVYTPKDSEVPQVRDESTSSIVLMAMQKGYDPAFIEKMMDLQERNEANTARKAFNKAVSDFHRESIEIVKDKENSQFSKGDKKAMYTSLGNLVNTVAPYLGKHGLSATWDINQNDKLIKVTCKLSHELGHSESVTMEAPPDDSGGNAKNPIQKIKSTVTYLKGVTFEAVTGMASCEDTTLDDDGNGAGGVDYITEDQQTDINDQIKELKVNEKKFMAYIGKALKCDIESVEKIPAKGYAIAQAAFKAKREAAK